MADTDPDRDHPLFEHTDLGPASSMEPDRLQAPLGQGVAAVACFWPDVIETITHGAEQLASLPSLQPFWEIEWNGGPLGVFYPGQGGALAAVCLELVIASGRRVVVACGGAGVLGPSVEIGTVLIIDGALRDEGTSYHYTAPSRWIAADPQTVAALTQIAEQAGIDYRVGPSWTTDGFFRITQSLARRRREEGCLAVECEAASLLAVAAFRGITFGQYLYLGDDPALGRAAALDHRLDIFRLASDAAVTAAGAMD